MTDPTGELTPPFVQRLRDDLLDNLPRYRRRRRRRQRLALGTVAVAVLAAAALASGPRGVRGGDRDDRDADVATEATAPGSIDAGETLPPDQEARGLVTSFVHDLRRGNLEAAAKRWSGDPSGDGLADRIAGVEQMRDELPWLADPAYPQWSLEAPIWSGPRQVVTVTATTRSGQPVRAAAFVVDRGAGPAKAIIQRLPSRSPASTPASGTTVARGQEIVVPVQPVAPVESEVHAWFGGVEVATTLTADGRAVKVRVPDTAIGQTVLTVLVPTPELPVAYGFWYPVG